MDITRAGIIEFRDSIGKTYDNNVYFFNLCTILENAC